MERANDIVDERRNIAKTFDTAFADLEELQTPFVHERYGHGYQSYPCLLKFSGTISEVNEKRNNWMEILQSCGISTRPATHAIHMLSFYKKK